MGPGSRTLHHSATGGVLGDWRATGERRRSPFKEFRFYGETKKSGGESRKCVDRGQGTENAIIAPLFRCVFSSNFLASSSFLGSVEGLLFPRETLCCLSFDFLARSFTHWLDLGLFFSCDTAHRVLIAFFSLKNAAGLKQISLRHARNCPRLLKTRSNFV